MPIDHAAHGPPWQDRSITDQSQILPEDVEAAGMVLREDQLEEVQRHSVGSDKSDAADGAFKGRVSKMLGR
ncbi:hypothetical protein PG990_007404 [Apiospora arundinis]